jgi:hypothetical protein
VGAGGSSFASEGFSEGVASAIKVTASVAFTEVTSSAKLALVIPKKFRHKKLINAKVDNNFFII